MAHYDTFRIQLALAHPAFGHALWDPNPGEQYPPVGVGDVGFIRHGKFHRLFNALLPGNHPSHERFGVPEYHETLQPSVSSHIDRSILQPNNICSNGVTVTSGACREDTLVQEHFRSWIIEHIDSWFAFSQRHRLGIEMEDIVLVTGCHRTRSWSNVAFYESRVDAQVSFGVQVPGDLGTTVNWQVSGQNNQGAVLNHGPSGENLPENQCIFIRGFRVERTLRLFSRIRAAAEPKPDPSGNDDELGTEAVSIPGVADDRDPLHVLLEYIAGRAPHCDLVVVHDDDLERVLSVGDGISLDTVQPDVVINNLERSRLETGVMSGSSPSNDRSPRTYTEHLKVAMLSKQHKTLDRPSSVPFFHVPLGVMNRDESAHDDPPSSPPAPASHSLHFSVILSHPGPRASDSIKLDVSATARSWWAGYELEVFARFPLGLDFGRGFVDINFAMWPLFKALNIDNVHLRCNDCVAPKAVCASPPPARPACLDVPRVQNEPRTATVARLTSSSRRSRRSLVRSHGPKLPAPQTTTTIAGHSADTSPGLPRSPSTTGFATECLAQPLAARTIDTTTVAAAVGHSNTAPCRACPHDNDDNEETLPAAAMPSSFSSARGLGQF
ncbi:hypothetical protein BJY52DRAFT_1350099 [Lactarius psammicola]|nr:hypothetical protein BJY52DRAFT_1350099 [Lactarius psammicola]